jgi:hypothetical protein
MDLKEDGTLMIEFKTKSVEDGVKHIHPILLEVMKEMDSWLEGYDGTHLRVSETLTTQAVDQRLKRVSSTHREGRAFDVGGVASWSKSKLQIFAQTFADKYKHLGAVSHSGSRSFLIAKDSGHGLHCHVQIGRDIVEQFNHKYKWNYPSDKKIKERA